MCPLCWVPVCNQTSGWAGNFHWSPALTDGLSNRLNHLEWPVRGNDERIGWFLNLSLALYSWEHRMQLVPLPFSWLMNLANGLCIGGQNIWLFHQDEVIKEPGKVTLLARTCFRFSKLLVLLILTVTRCSSLESNKSVLLLVLCCQFQKRPSNGAGSILETLWHGMEEWYRTSYIRSMKREKNEIGKPGTAVGTTTGTDNVGKSGRESSPEFPLTLALSVFRSLPGPKAPSLRKCDYLDSCFSTLLTMDDDGSPTKTAPKFTRCRTGCLRCRKRRRKCE